VAGKSTRQIEIQSGEGYLLQQETKVYTGSGYETITWQVHTYDELGRRLETSSSNGDLTQSSWTCCGKESQTDAQGIARSFAYDDLNRLSSEIKEGGQAPLTTRYTYDALGRRLSQTVASGSLSLTQQTGFDPAGRIQLFNRSAYNYGDKARRCH
jgi:YD repeat-containing protein